MTDLLGDVPEPRKKRERRKSTDSGVRDCFDRFFAGFIAKFNPKDTHVDEQVRPMLKGGKDGKHFQHMLATWGKDKTLDLIDRFFVSTDPRIVRSDYTVGALYNLAQYLLLESQRSSVDARTAHNVDAAHRAMRRR